MTELISRLEFQSIVNQHNSDFRSRKLKTWVQFIFMLFAQLSGRSSRRETVTGINSVCSASDGIGLLLSCIVN
ncbi:MAG TPA: DUF4372 domain-containing protein [Calditrichaeota bacterium]|nr:DUF4372 domain-containing protein [Calditrichota bacterium]